MSKFPIISDCPGCQAFEDAKGLFEQVEATAISEDLDADRMCRALRELLALWYAITIAAYPELDIQPTEVCSEFERALAGRLAQEVGHVH